MTVVDAIKRHARLKKKDPALYALAVEFETARFAKQQVSEIVGRIVKHKSRASGVSKSNPSIDLTSPQL